MRLSLLAFSTSVGLFTLLTTSLASAQVTGASRGFSLNRFDPSERGSEWFVLDSLDLRGKARPALGAVFDWGYKPLVIYDANGNEQTAVVEHQVFLHLGGSLVLADRFRVGLNLPLGIYQTGDDGVSNGIAYKAPESAVGDLRLSGDVRLLGKYGSAFNSAVGVALYFPTGDRDAFTSDGNVRFQ